MLLDHFSFQLQGHAGKTSPRCHALCRRAGLLLSLTPPQGSDVVLLCKHLALESQPLPYTCGSLKVWRKLGLPQTTPSDNGGKGRNCLRQSSGIILALAFAFGLGCAWLLSLIACSKLSTLAWGACSAGAGAGASSLPCTAFSAALAQSQHLATSLTSSLFSTKCSFTKSKERRSCQDFFLGILC